MIILTEPEGVNSEEPRIDKGKGRALEIPVTGPVRILKRKRSLGQDDAPGPSKKRVLIPKDEGDEDEERGDGVEEEGEDEDDEYEGERENEGNEEEGDGEWDDGDDGDDDEDGSYTETPSSTQRHVKWKNDVKYKRKCLTCEECQRTFTTKENLERHAPTHVKDKILFVCAGGQGKWSNYHSLR